MAERSETYVSYLLRIWEFEKDGQPNWRASLECVQTGEQTVFSDLALLLDFLARYFSLDANRVKRGD